MHSNYTVVLGNETSTPSPRSSQEGLSVGLTLFFLLLFIIAGVIVYKYRNKIRSMLQSGHSSQKKEDYTETPVADPHHYTTLSREQSIGQTPIYENLNSRAPAHNRHAGNQSRTSREPEEDLYLHCELPDDAIYSNDPACNLSIMLDSKEEDVYIVPES